jgi:hypothetical protein
MARPTGAKASPRSALCGASSHRIGGAAPVRFIRLPKKLSFWLNNVDGDCVTAEEAFAKACMGILISDQTVKQWATQHDVMNGAYLNQVLGWMAQAGFSQDGNVYNDGPAKTVDYTNRAALSDAIYTGPVKLGLAAGQLQDRVGEKNGWVITGLTSDQNEDHCTSLCGYGEAGWLAQQLGGQLPSGIDGNLFALAMFTWSTVGIIDPASMMSITGEAWVRSPTNITVGNNPVSPDDVLIPSPGPAPNPTPTPPPSPIPYTIIQQVDAVLSRVIMMFRFIPQFQAVLIEVRREIDQILAGSLMIKAIGSGNLAGGHIPPSIIQLIDNVLIGAAVVYPEWADMLKAAKVIIDKLLPIV